MKLRVDPVPVLHPANMGGQRRLMEILHKVGQLFDGRISFGDGANKENLDIEFRDVTSHAVADTEFTVSHSLGRLPGGYMVVKRDKAATVYNGITSWTDSAIYLRCNVSSASLRLIIF
jgi:hypothetical protein